MLRFDKRLLRLVLSFRDAGCFSVHICLNAGAERDGNNCLQTIRFYAVLITAGIHDIINPINKKDGMMGIRRNLRGILKMTWDLYMCFSNVNRVRINGIVARLEEAGFSCCIPGRDYDFFPVWEENMTDAVYSSTMVLYFDSEAARKSPRLRTELDTIGESGLLKIDFDQETVTPEDVLSVVKERYQEAARIRMMARRPVPYSGEDPYVFVSYAHRNMDRVIPLVRLLQENGYRVWYDEGIDPGTEWADNIADHLEKARCLCACLSKEYLESTNCKDELYFAGTLGMDILLLYLEEIVLEKGMAMRGGKSSEIHSDVLGDTGMLLQNIRGIQGFRACLAAES